MHKTISWKTSWEKKYWMNGFWKQFWGRVLHKLGNNLRFLEKYLPLAWENLNHGTTFFLSLFRIIKFVFLLKKFSYRWTQKFFFLGWKCNWKLCWTTTGTVHYQAWVDILTFDENLSYIQLSISDYIHLVNKPYVNGMTLKEQNVSLKFCQPL